MCYSGYEIGSQPCDDFTTMDEEWFGLVHHVCPKLTACVCIVRHVFATTTRMGGKTVLGVNSNESN